DKGDEMKVLFLMLKVRQDFHNSFTVALQKFPKTEVKEYNYLERFKAIGRDRMNQEVLALVKSWKPWITLCIMYQDQIKRETFEAMREAGTVVCGWFCDDRARWNDYSKNYAPHLDHSITTDHFSVKRYEDIGCKVILSQWGSTPEMFKPVVADKIYDISFIGGVHGGRKEWIEFLKSKGVRVAWFGNEPGKYLNVPDQNKVIAQSKINLNFTGNSHDNSIKQIKTRFFEIPAAGGFLLSEYAPKIEDYYVLGKEIVAFKTQKELVEKIRYFCEHDE
ncbi:unnamed protein product, partial [marine sediment metagenome]